MSSPGKTSLKGKKRYPLNNPSSGAGRVLRLWRGRAGLVLLVLLLGIAWLAPVLASSKPVVCQYKGQWEYPGIVDVVRNIPLMDRVVEPVKPFSLPSYSPDVVKKDCTSWVSALIPYSPTNYSSVTLEPPSASHWLGTDDLGRDVAARLIHATGMALKVGIGTMLLAGLVGILIGACAGYAGRWADAILSRVVEIVICFPAFFLVLSILVWARQPGVWHIVLVLGLTMWTGIARYVRAEMLRLRNSEMALAARAVGLPGWRIAVRHLLPNAVAPAFSVLPFIVANAILIEAGLSWLGFGIPEPAPSWGGMLRGAYDHYLVAPWLVWPPCVMIFLAVLSNHLLGDAMREVMDVKGRRLHSQVGHVEEDHEDADTNAGSVDDEAFLSVRNLRITYDSETGNCSAVRGANMAVGRGRVTALVGASGCGKSSITLAVAGLLPDSAKVTGEVIAGKQDLLNLDEDELRRVRRKRIGIVFQDPMGALNPMMRIGRQVAEAVEVHQGVGFREAMQETIELLRQVELPDPESLVRCWPHQLSGGMRQRVMIAMALAGRPDLLIADEPTTALDVTVQEQIIALLKQLQKQYEMSMLWITHDFGVVQRVADDVCVMDEGCVVESGSLNRVMGNPGHAVTRELIRHARASGKLRSNSSKQDVEDQGSLLLVKDCHVRYRQRGRNIEAVSGVSLEIAKGDTFGLVGESGCGKSSLLRAIALLTDDVTADIVFDGQSLEELNTVEVRALRRRLQILFQDAGGSLNPRMRVGSLLAEGLRCHESISRKEALKRVGDALGLVGLDASNARRYPHEFSGGQKQRIALARAMVLEPELLLCDEPVTGLDPVAKTEILELIQSLQDQTQMACMLVSHDLDVVRRFCDRVAVMYCGRIVEVGSAADVLESPKHPYTQALKSAAAELDGGRIVLQGEPADPAKPPSGCVFHPRCPIAEDKCADICPALEGNLHKTACLVVNRDRDGNNPAG